MPAGLLDWHLPSWCLPGKDRTTWKRVSTWVGDKLALILFSGGCSLHIRTEATVLSLSLARLEYSQAARVQTGCLQRAWGRRNSMHLWVWGVQQVQFLHRVPQNGGGVVGRDLCFLPHTWTSLLQWDKWDPGICREGAGKQIEMLVSMYSGEISY